MVLFSEMIEHPDGWESVVFVRAISYHPNPSREDCQHAAPYCHDELAGLLLANGSETKALRRVRNDAAIRRTLPLHFAAPVHHYLNNGPAPSILVAAQRGR